MVPLQPWKVIRLREGHSDKKTNAEDGYTGPAETMAHNSSITHHVIWMDTSLSNRDGALPVETRQAGRVPGP